MTNEELDQLLIELNKLAERGELEFFTGKVWTTWGGPLVGMLRIKPKPREFWFNIPESQHGETTAMRNYSAYKLKEEADKYRTNNERTAFFREVIE